MIRRFAMLVTLLATSFALTGLSTPVFAASEAEGNPWWIWILIFFVFVAFAGVVIWWWLRGEEEDELDHHAEAKAAADPDTPSAYAKAYLPEAEVDAPAVDVSLPDVGVAAPSLDADLPEVDIDAPSLDMDVPAAKAEAPDVALRAPAVDIDVPPTKSAAPVKPDDLKRIEGIGPKISSVLQAGGIATFAQLAKAEVGQLRHILEQADPRLLRITDPTTWPKQAELAAQGAWAALEELQDRLQGGRRN